MPNQAGPGTPLTDGQRIRYQACYNASDYDAPPYAVMSRVYLNGAGGSNVDGTWVINVNRPDSVIAARQCAADLVFNGPEVLRSKRPGRCTEDFPCRGLHLREDTLNWRPYISVDGQSFLTHASIYCGPKADSWLLWNSGFAFRWLHRDAAALLNDKFETGIIVPTPPPWIGSTFELLTSSANLHTDIAVDASLGVVSPGSPSEPIWVKVRQSLEPYVDDLTVDSYETFNGIKFNVGGIYKWDFHCTLFGGSDAPQGAALVIRSYSNATELVPYCYRVHQIEIDNYGNEIQRSGENVAMSGQTFFNAGDVLTFRNASAYKITCAASFCTIHRVGPQ